MTDAISDILNHEIEIEGGAVSDAIDNGGRTQYGISEKDNPAAWADGNVTVDEAKEIFLTKYVKAPGFDHILNDKLLAQFVDFGINSGPFVAIQKAQIILGLTVDGLLGPITLHAINAAPSDFNNKLVAERVKMLCNICVKTPSQLKFLNGWISRALEFLV